MRETIELRVPEANAEEFLPPGMGMRLGMVRKVSVDTSDPTYAEIGRLQLEFRARGKWFFHGWGFHRHYSMSELAQAELLCVRPGRTFEPPGELCGTVYDDSSGCPECGTGARQTTQLFLDGRRIPKGPDFACTIADENIVSSRAAAVLRGLTGARLEPVRLSNEHGAVSTEYFQLEVTAPYSDLDPKTLVGEGPFERPDYGLCPRGDLAGLNLISEVYVRRKSLSDADVLATAQWVGVRRGLLRPRRLMLLSPKGFRAIQDAGLKGLVIEVAHVV